VEEKFGFKGKKDRDLGPERINMIKEKGERT
jgi:hypothetical protein